MRKVVPVFSLLVLLLGLAKPAAAATPLVGDAWLNSTAGAPNLIVLDIRN